jgi:hypothetical protein
VTAVVTSWLSAIVVRAFTMVVRGGMARIGPVTTSSAMPSHLGSRTRLGLRMLLLHQENAQAYIKTSIITT